MGDSMAKEITADVIRQITRNLVEFGYEGLTEEHTQTAIDKLMAGEKPTGIIGMMTQGMLIENGYMDKENE
jgi:hypothetical protein